MPRQTAKKSSKAAKSEKKYLSVKFTGRNKNVFEGRIYEPKKTKSKSDYKRYFLLVNINGISISSSLMVADNADDTFIAWPSYYNESKGEYQNQVYIADDGLKEDVDDFIGLCLDKLGIASDEPMDVDDEDEEDNPFI